MLWPILYEKAREQGLPLSTVVAEVFHLIVLDALFAIPESQWICFQGGTSIHLLYGGYRYSEDLDFAGETINPTLAQRLITRSQSKIEKTVIQLLGQGQCDWEFPSPLTDRRVCAFWFHFQPKGKQQKFRVKMEFARYPVYESKVASVHSDLDVLQFHPLITGLTTEELLAEKITAVGGRPHIKGRDLFDLWYLSEVLATSLQFELVKRKLQDYHVNLSRLGLEQKLTNYKAETLTAEMKRFLPQRYRRQLQQSNYEGILKTAMQIMQSVMMAFSPPRKS